MGWIILLVFLGLLLYFAELVLLPGITVAAVGSFCCLVAASALAFMWDGVLVGFVVLGTIIVLLGVMTAIFLRPKTWKKAALHTNIEGSVDDAVSTRFAVGQVGYALTRLAPMGNILVDGVTVEAKTMGGYVDEGSSVKIVGFDNQNVIVEREKL